MNETSQTGLIKWFSPSKGYGFITLEDGNDVFIHHTGLDKDQDRRLFPGDKVTFTLINGEKGLKATGMRRIARADGQPET